MLYDTCISTESYFAISNRKFPYPATLYRYLSLTPVLGCRHNVGFTRQGDVKLFDFGLCRELPSREDGVVSPNEMFLMSGVGTRRYMACEIINTGRYNLKADVYSWAMIFWEMMSLRKPFAPYSMGDHRRLVCHGGERPEIQQVWPGWVQGILQLSWEEVVEYRFSMEEAYENLREAMSHQWERQNSDTDFPSRKIVHNNHVPQPVSPTAVSDAIESEFLLTLPQLAKLRGTSLSHDSEWPADKDSSAVEDDSP
jgi:serine/threonine protein kinase